MTEIIFWGFILFQVVKFTEFKYMYETLLIASKNYALIKKIVCFNEVWHVEMLKIYGLNIHLICR